MRQPFVRVRMGIKVILSLVIMAVYVLVPQKVAAHVLLADSKGRYGAVLHVAPDDDPKAGVVSGLNFILQSVPNLDKAGLKLVIKHDDSVLADEINPTLNGNTVSTSFVFPRGGLYLVILDIIPTNSKEPSIIFNTSVRVSGGTAQVVSGSSPDWAKIGIVGSVWFMLLLGGIAFSRRRDIIKNSR